MLTGPGLLTTGHSPSQLQEYFSTVWQLIYSPNRADLHSYVNPAIPSSTPDVHSLAQDANDANENPADEKCTLGPVQ